MASSDSKYDFVILGATGFTGQFVVEEVARTASKEQGLKWAVAGRNAKRLEAVLKQAADKTEISLVSVIPVIVCDVSDANSLAAMAKQAKVVLNCVGPYRFFGEAVVKACVENGAHHIDISGEPQFLETMQLKYNDAAKEKNVYIIGACGFDSIPAEMGLLFTDQKFQGEINEVESFISLDAKKGMKVHYGTWQSAIHGFAHRNELSTIRKQLYPQRMPKSDFPQAKRFPVSYVDMVRSWCIPFPGSDKTVVYRTQRFLHETKGKRPIQFMPYVQQPSLISTVIMLFVGAIFAVLANFKCGRYLLEKFPWFFSGGVFSHEGPTREQMDNTSFQMTFFAKGWSASSGSHSSKPDREIITRLTGPEPGYVATPICLVQSGLVILKESEKMPDRGGVLAPGAAFWDTSLVTRLQENGLNLEVVEKPKA